MSEELPNSFENANNQLDSLSFDFDENPLKPENIFCPKESSEIQFSSKILCFPFNLDFFKLIFLKDEKDPELVDPFCTVILGDIEKVRFSESVLKMVFYSKDKRTPLNMADYSEEMKSLTNFPGIEFICICLNKMFIQFEDDISTKEAFNSLQKNYNSSDFLYEEDCSMNSFENLNKGGNSFFSSEKKNNKDDNNYDELLSPNKSVKKLDFFADFDYNNNFSEQNDSNLLNTSNNNNFKGSDLFQKNIWNSEMKSKKDNTPIKEDQKIEENSNKNQNSVNQIYPQIFPSQLFSPFVFPKINMTNNISKPKQQINPLLFMQYSKMNPLLLQTAFALQQNMLKLSQMNLNSKEKNNINNINFNGKNANINNETERGSAISNNKESSTHSNTSSTVSSKESSPSVNYQDKSYNGNNNMNFAGINFGLFNGFNSKNTIQNLNIINNNKMKNNKEFNNDLLNISKANNINNNNKNGIHDSSILKRIEETKINPNFNLQQIVTNNSFKEYVPKNPNSIMFSHNQNSPNSEKNNSQPNPQSPEKEVEFHTNSTRDYQYKYVSRYIVQIENEKNFPVTKMIIGNRGKLLRNIIVKNCINNGDGTTKIRLRGKGSGYKEGPKNEESQDPMELCISSLNLISYYKCSQDIENLLRNVYYQYYLYQCNNKKNNDESPIVMKKILKYPYVVNRYNTLAKEEKRRKKEEEMKQVNQVNKIRNLNNKYE